MTAGIQRLPVLGAVVASLQAGRHVIVAAALVFFFKSPLWVLFASLAGFAMTTIYHVVRWVTFRISVDADELRTSHVFITRTERRIPIASIHDLHFEQSLLQRIAGVVTVRIETAGGSGTEAELSGLLRSQADALKIAIDEVRLRGSQGAASAPAPEPAERVVAALSLRDLILAGATSATIWIVGGALVSAWFFLDDLVPGLEERLAPLLESMAGFVAAANLLTLAAGAAALLVVLLLAAAAVSIVRTCIRFWGFRATWNGSRLLRSCGLITKRRQVLQSARIQRILVRETLLQKWVGCVSIELGTAALGSREEEDRGRTFTIPILRAGQVQPLLDMLAPGAASMDGTFDPVSPLASRRYLIRSGILFGVVSAGIAAWWRLLPAALVWILFIRNLVRAPRLAKIGGFRVTEDLVQFRSGAFARRLVTLPLGRVQGVALSQTVFDRRLRLARVRVSGAGDGNAGALSDIPEENARSLVAVVAAAAERESAARDLENPNGSTGLAGVGSELPGVPAPA